MQQQNNNTSAVTFVSVLALDGNVAVVGHLKDKLKNKKMC